MAALQVLHNKLLPLLKLSRPVIVLLMSVYVISGASLLSLSSVVTHRTPIIHWPEANCACCRRCLIVVFPLRLTLDLYRLRFRYWEGGVGVSLNNLWLLLPSTFFAAELHEIWATIDHSLRPRIFCSCSTTCNIDLSFQHPGNCLGRESAH